MRKRSVMFLLLRGLVWGLLVVFVNGISLPVLVGLFSRIRAVLEKGVWPSGPVSVVELWVIHFVFGIVFSFLPSLAVTALLSLGIQSLWPKRLSGKWSSICTGLVLGSVATGCYVFLLFSVDPVMNMQDHGLLAALVLVEQAIIYVGLAYRLFWVNSTKKGL